MKLIVGLGNPGAEYAGTRHNAGYMALERLAKELGFSFSKEKHFALVAEGYLDGEKIMLMEPLTYMNESGRAVADAVKFYKLLPEDLLIIHDDMDLPCGRMRMRSKGSAGGQKGMTNIICALNTDQITRIKIGISHPQHGTVVDFVLHPFTAEEKQLVEPMLDKAAAAAICWLKQGTDIAMNRFNLKEKTIKAKQSAANSEAN